jgi:hypothetical protein
MPATTRLFFGVVFVSAVGWASQAYAQLGVGTWLRTDEHGKGITMTVESPFDGTDVPALVGGKPSGETMAIKRVDDHHYTAVVKMSGKPYGTSSAVLSPDGKTLTVESVIDMGGKQQKIIETWVKQ